MAHRVLHSGTASIKGDFHHETVLALPGNRPGHHCACRDAGTRRRRHRHRRHLSPHRQLRPDRRRRQDRTRRHLRNHQRHPRTDPHADGQRRRPVQARRRENQDHHGGPPERSAEGARRSRAPDHAGTRGGTDRQLYECHRRDDQPGRGPLRNSLHVDGQLLAQPEQARPEMVLPHQPARRDVHAGDVRLLQGDRREDRASRQIRRPDLRRFDLRIG